MTHVSLLASDRLQLRRLGLHILMQKGTFLTTTKELRLKLVTIEQSKQTTHKPCEILPCISLVSAVRRISLGSDTDGAAETGISVALARLPRLAAEMPGAAKSGAAPQPPARPQKRRPCKATSDADAACQTNALQVRGAESQHPSPRRGAEPVSPPQVKCWFRPHNVAGGLPNV